jgi:hypothetical protein
MSRIARLALAFVFCQPRPPSRSSVADDLRRSNTLHQVEPLDGNVELRVVGVEEQHELAAARPRSSVCKPPKRAMP